MVRGIKKTIELTGRGPEGASQFSLPKVTRGCCVSGLQREAAEQQVEDLILFPGSLVN